MPVSARALVIFALLCVQSFAASSCQEDETSLLQVTSEMKYGHKRENEESDGHPPSYKTPTLSLEGNRLKVSWKMPKLLHPVKSTAVQVRAVGENTWKFVDSGKNILVHRGGSSVSAPATSILVGGLDTAKEYEARVAMKNAHGWGDYSPSSESIALAPRTIGKQQAPVILEEEAEQEADELIGGTLEDVEDHDEETAADGSKASSKANENVQNAVRSNEASKAALEAAARLTAENAVMARSAVAQAEVKDNAAQTELAEKKVVATKAEEEALRAEKKAKQAAEAVKKAATLAEESKKAARTAKAHKEAAEMMLNAAEELAGQTKKELEAAKVQTSNYAARKDTTLDSFPEVEAEKERSYLELAHAAEKAGKSSKTSESEEIVENGM